MNGTLDVLTLVALFVGIAALMGVYRGRRYLVRSNRHEDLVVKACYTFRGAERWRKRVPALSAHYYVSYEAPR